MKPELKEANKAYREDWPIIRRRSANLFRWATIAFIAYTSWWVYGIITNANF